MALIRYPLSVLAWYWKNIVGAGGKVRIQSNFPSELSLPWKIVKIAMFERLWVWIPLLWVWILLMALCLGMRQSCHVQESLAADCWSTQQETCYIHRGSTSDLKQINLKGIISMELPLISHSFDYRCSQIANGRQMFKNQMFCMFSCS